MAAPRIPGTLRARRRALRAFRQALRAAPRFNPPWLNPARPVASWAALGASSAILAWSPAPAWPTGPHPSPIQAESLIQSPHFTNFAPATGPIGGTPQ